MPYLFWMVHDVMVFMACFCSCVSCLFDSSVIEQCILEPSLVNGSSEHSCQQIAYFGNSKKYALKEVSLILAE